MYLFCIVCAVIATFISFVEGQNRCLTPDNIDGECISLNSCEPLQAIIHKKGKTEKDVSHLRQYGCGFQGQVPKVCCPGICRTPEGEKGKCVDINSCMHLTTMLQSPVSEDKLTYVKKSRCQGESQYSVCCGPSSGVNNVVTSTPATNAAVTAPAVVPTGICAATTSSFPPDPSSGCCGLDNRFDDRIVGGNATTVDQYPWLVLVEYIRLGEIKLLCGGSLISDKYVLTAAHCVIGDVLDHGTPKNIRLGEYDTSNEGEDCQEVAGEGEDCTEGIVVIPIEKTIPHLEYDATTKKNDIALIRMKQTAPRTDFIRPICLPTFDFAMSPPASYQLFVAGWGATETHTRSSVKLHLNLTIAHPEGCQAAYGTPLLNADIWEGHICAGGEAGKDSCKGDSGGPLMYQHEKKFVAIGIVSFGPSYCGTPGIPGVYTNVYFYLDWIRSNIQE